jgi:hypothetical protein
VSVGVELKCGGTYMTVEVERDGSDVRREPDASRQELDEYGRILDRSLFSKLLRGLNIDQCPVRTTNSPQSRQTSKVSLRSTRSPVPPG